MSQVVQSAAQEFWRSPTVLDPPVESALLTPPIECTNEACADCATEFMIGARFCHACGLPRTAAAAPVTMLAKYSARARAHAASLPVALRKVAWPAWLHYLHFHEIKQAVGLPTASLIAFIIGVGCVIGAIAVGFVYKASNLAEFQAIQMWRIEWLLAATASFVCGILLKKPSNGDSD